MSTLHPTPLVVAGAEGSAEDNRRVAAVRRLLAAGPEVAGLDRLTRLAADLLGAEFSQVSLLAEEQYVASLHGADLGAAVQATPSADSLCAITLAQRTTVIINDTRADARAATLAPVVDGGIRAYLGVPLVDSAGLGLGALCVYDRHERSWTANDVGVL